MEASKIAKIEVRPYKPFLSGYFALPISDQQCMSTQAISLNPRLQWQFLVTESEIQIKEGDNNNFNQKKF